MNGQRFEVNQHSINNIINWIDSGQVAIPEIQRPFVWKASKVRDLMDSLYKGFPIGYIITWQGPDIRLKDGTLSEGKKILIDGQQRATALRAAVLGFQVVNQQFKKVHIRISFNPSTEVFEVQNVSTIRDPEWIADISQVMNEPNIIGLHNEYMKSNPNADSEKVANAFTRLSEIKLKQVGLINLDSALDIETVTEIFIRINSAGVVLSQADFAMSKIAASEQYEGHTIRKCIDYFCHLAVAPEYFEVIRENDKDFSETEFFRKMTWLKDENDDLYDPTYTDMLRVSFMTEFNRGRMSDLVNLLSGRNFESREFEEEIARTSFKRLESSLYRFMNKSSFQRFVMIIRSAGFVNASLIRSQNTLNFAYSLFLKMKMNNMPNNVIEATVRRWYVMSVLTGRYSSSTESSFHTDIHNVNERGAVEVLKDIEKADLSEAFWTDGLIQDMVTQSTGNPYFNVYIAAQCYLQDKGLFSKDISVQDMVLFHGDIHHIFPREYLKKQGFSRSQINQIANYTYMQTDINISVGAKAPNDYFSQLLNQCKGGKLKFGNIADEDDLRKNLRENCVPEDVFSMTHEQYGEFLEKRRVLMAEKIKGYYKSL